LALQADWLDDDDHNQKGAVAERWAMPVAPVASKLDGRPRAAAADAAASKTTPPVVPVADPVDYTFAPKLEVKPKLKVFAPLQPTLAVAVAPSFANASRCVWFGLFWGAVLRVGFSSSTTTTPTKHSSSHTHPQESLTTSFTPTATVAKTGTLNNAVETVYTPPAGGKK
jgi:hypothetical protein